MRWNVVRLPRPLQVARMQKSPRIAGGIAFGIEGWLHWNQLSLVAVIGHVSAAYQPAECAMLYGVAVIVTALVVSTLAAVVVDTTYRAISERH
jgi:hypothetical protein